MFLSLSYVRIELLRGCAVQSHLIVTLPRPEKFKIIAWGLPYNRAEQCFLHLGLNKERQYCPPISYTRVLKGARQGLSTYAYTRSRGGKITGPSPKHFGLGSQMNLDMAGAKGREYKAYGFTSATTSKQGYK
ncbi:hypothetical protein Tco_0702357 [Tanacetum coccineum]|uniref:Uncharacterized protein n=1 Tax=Tanacetum coccineum TaxID=301880 RepID=A0ABQ4XWL3_9ASTR